MDDQVLNLLTAKQAGAILNVNPVTVGRWAKAGLIPFVEVPPYGKRMYKRSDVHDLANRRAEVGE